MTKNSIFEPFAKIALDAKNNILTIEKKLIKTDDKNEKAVLKKQISGLKHLIDRSFRLTADFLPVHASKKAKDYCEKNNLGDIYKVSWDKQTEFEGKKSRKECSLKHEHKIPVSNLIERLFGVSTVNEAISIFESQEIVWVLKDEDKRLPKSKRKDSDEAYRLAEIEICKNPNTTGPLLVR
jgi:hypothetical protein